VTIQLPAPVLHSLGDAQTNFDALARILEVSRVTVLPLSPFDGQVVDFLADDTNGIVWRLRYRVSSASSYKWEFVGGAGLHAAVDVRESTSSTAYTNLTTTGPTVTPPLAGDYVIALGGYLFGDTAGTNVLMSFAIGGAVALDASGIDVYGAAVSGGFTNAGNFMRELRAIGLAAGAALTAKYRVTGGTGSFQERWIRVLPIRVG
jgi:hypothetical protein